MLEGLSGKDEKREARVLVDGGKTVEADAETQRASEAARALGKRGAEAAAEARKAKEAKPEGDAADDAEDTAEGDDKPLGNPRRDPRARVQQATREAAEARKALEAERRERAALAQRLEALERAQAPKAPEAAAPAARGDVPEHLDPNDPPPDIDKATDYKAWQRENDAWNRREAKREWQREQAKEARTQELYGHVNGIVERADAQVAAFAKDNPDFYEKTAPLADLMGKIKPTWQLDPKQEVTASNVIVDEILGSETAPALMLYFTEHPQTLRDISQLKDSRAVVREIAKIEDRLTRPSAAAADTSHERGVSKAPQPVKSATGAPPASSPDLTKITDFDSFVSAAEGKRKRA